MGMTEWINRVHFGDCLETLRRMPDGIVNTCVTSPPYFGLRSYDERSWVIDPRLPADKREWLEAELLRRGIHGR
jgi:DNA modification methylase